MRKNVTERYFKCPECGTVLTAYKKSSRRTSVNHIKHMYCYKCKEVRPFIQLSKYMQQLQNSPARAFLFYYLIIKNSNFLRVGYFNTLK